MICSFIHVMIGGVPAWMGLFCPLSFFLSFISFDWSEGKKLPMTEKGSHEWKPIGQSGTRLLKLKTKKISQKHQSGAASLQLINVIAARSPSPEVAPTSVFFRSRFLPGNFSSYKCSASAASVKRLLPGCYPCIESASADSSIAPNA